MIILPCPRCGGDKGWAVPTGIDYRDGSLIERWETCCETGEIEVETLPAECEDLEPLVPADLPPSHTDTDLWWPEDCLFVAGYWSGAWHMEIVGPVFPVGPDTGWYHLPD